MESTFASHPSDDSNSVMNITASQHMISDDDCCRRSCRIRGRVRIRVKAEDSI